MDGCMFLNKCPTKVCLANNNKKKIYIYSWDAGVGLLLSLSLSSSLSLIPYSVHNFPLPKSLLTNVQVPKEPTDYYGTMSASHPVFCSASMFVLFEPFAGVWYFLCNSRAILMFHNYEGQSHKAVSTNHNFWRERRAEADSNRGPSAYQPNALPLGQTGSQNAQHWK